MAETKDLAMILNAGIPLVAIESADERRVLQLLLRLAMQRQLGFYEWRVTRGLELGGFGAAPDKGRELSDPEALLAHIASTPGPALYALCDFHPYLRDEPKNVRYLKDIALDQDRLKNTVALVSHSLSVPAELGRMTAKFNLRLPSDDELVGMIRAQAKTWSEQHVGSKVRTDQGTLDQLVANLRGVSHADAQVLIRHAIFDDGAITESDIPEVNRLKFELMDSEGVLCFEYDTESLANVAGLDNLKSWLTLRRQAFMTGGADGSTSDRPRGVLLLGVQGGGKSLAARAIAGFWGIPLLRLDFGTLYNKYFGETERNLRNSLKQAELMAPCVLWMDEIEKGVATGGSDNATSKRVLSTLLTWMAENRKPVFIVATANDIAELPPELVRKGRLDEIFFVDLPDATVREEIFRIHLGKRGLDPDRFDLAALAAAAEGFTGAEIEEAIVSARYLAASRASPTGAEPTAVTEADVVGAVNRTFPMSVMRAESIDALRRWARERTVPA
ncbi:MAG: AAA family ATPase [Pseudomonadales bacterium]